MVASNSHWSVVREPADGTPMSIGKFPQEEGNNELKSTFEHEKETKKKHHIGKYGMECYEFMIRT